MDVLTAEQRRFNMSRIRGRDTVPELLIRRALHAKGFRYRLHDRRLPGRPDLVFPKYRAVIFIHGCFWHGHDCHLFKWPSTRKEFWQEKIERNRARDDSAIRKLQENAWRVLIVWECALKGPHRTALPSITYQCVSFLQSRLSALSIPGTPLNHESAAISRAQGG
ncbi:very short patch repair endonuclease [Hyphomicrobium sp. D-2]|uniref:very short patch repair endonuclease n=1 Tax=Hyphomicrobium sp. D-2 TaxID=3041621 RepID=UPI0024562ECF|nr:very short patch repair endonuclease [Hyphomicrobium sp. D-2]MDH4980936.1 very short patch repair endonuclease [Hyphomicrobium sp. D-2]